MYMQSSDRAATVSSTRPEKVVGAAMQLECNSLHLKTAAYCYTSLSTPCRVSEQWMHSIYRLIWPHLYLTYETSLHPPIEHTSV